MKQETTKSIIERINETYEDIRAEVIVSDLLAGDVHKDEIHVHFIGQQKRPKQRDIANVDLQYSTNHGARVKLSLNRDSIYDTLPEGVFHQPMKNKSETFSVDAMVDEYNRQQKEEKEARQFFAPFENELFLQKSLIELEEFQQLLSIQQSNLKAAVLNKLGIDPALPKYFTSKLIRMIPYASEIAGDMEKTEEIFRLLFENTATLTITHHSDFEQSDCISCLGQSILGSDSIAGDNMVPDHPVIDFKIGPIYKNDLRLFKKDGWKAKALQPFINFFISVEWDLSIRFELHNQASKSFNLNNRQADACLGYTTTI